MAKGQARSGREPKKPKKEPPPKPKPGESTSMAVNSAKSKPKGA